MLNNIIDSAIIIHDNKNDIINKKRKKKITDEENLVIFLMRAECLHKSLHSSHNYIDYEGIHQEQPYEEKHAICAIVCLSHIINEALPIFFSNGKNSNIGRDRFEINCYKKYHSNINGHYHTDVLQKILCHYYNLQLKKIKSKNENGIQLRKPTDIREFIINYVKNYLGKETTFVIQASIILTSRANYARKHYFVVKTFSNILKPPVLLD